MSTSSVPRATMRPRERVDVLPSSSVARLTQQVQRRLKVQTRSRRRSKCNQGRTYLVASPEHHQAPDSSTGHDPSVSLVLFRSVKSALSSHRTTPKNQASNKRQLTFPSPIEFHYNLFVHVLGQIQYILFLRLLSALCVSSPSSTSTASLTASSSSSCPTASEVTSLRHGSACVAIGGGVVVESTERKCGSVEWGLDGGRMQWTTRLNLFTVFYSPLHTCLLYQCGKIRIWHEAKPRTGARLQDGYKTLDLWTSRS